MLLEILTLIQEWPAVHYHQVEVICRGLSSNRKLRQRKFHEHVAYTQCTCSCLTVTSVPPLIDLVWLLKHLGSLLFFLLKKDNNTTLLLVERIKQYRLKCLSESVSQTVSVSQSLSEPYSRHSISHCAGLMYL